jgi:hypothetical protein
MRSKFLAGTAALAIAGGAVLASSAPASARWVRGGWGWGPAAAAGALVGGAVAAARRRHFGGATATAIIPAIHTPAISLL